VWEIASALEPIFSAHPLAMWIAKASGFFPPMKPPLSFSTDRQTLSDFLGHADYAGLTTRRCAKDGTIIDTEIHGVLLTVNGVCAGAYGIYQDIRDRKRLEEEMRFGQKCRLSAGWQGLLTPVKNGAIMAGVGRGH